MRTLFTTLSKAMAITCLLSLNNVVLANEESHNHEAHVHGYAQLTLAAENGKLLISLATPANSLVGFEHRAETPEERAKITVLKATLNNADNIVSLSKSGCALKKVNIDLDGILPLKKHDKHSHHDEHHHHKDHPEEEHNEVVIDYSYQCNKEAINNTATINIFKHYPAIEVIQAMWISESNQGAINLTAQSNTLTWK